MMATQDHDQREMGSRYEEPEPDVLTAESPVRSATDGSSIYVLLISGDKPRFNVLKEVSAIRQVEHRNMQERPDLPWWEIRCPHGGSLVVFEPQDFPAESTRSNCGRPNCWIVFYGPKREDSAAEP